MSELRVGIFANGAATAAFASLVASAAKAGANYQKGEQPDNINEKSIKGSRLRINTTQVKGPNGEIINRVDIAGTYDDQTGYGIGKDFEATIEDHFSGRFEGSDGAVYELNTDLSKLGSDITSQLRGADITLTSGGCSGGGFACAFNSTGEIRFPNLESSFSTRAIVHEFGHIVGFDHFSNGTNSLMSYDPGQNLEGRHLDLIWNRYNLD